MQTTGAERSVNRLSKLFGNLNRAANQVGRNNQLNNQLQQSQQKANGVVAKIREWASNQHQVTNATKSTNSTLSSISSKLKTIAGTYLGMMGAKSVINTTDTLTSARNRLGDVNGWDAVATQESMDKMYSAAQKARTSYSNLISNASKSMVLAGDSFQGQMDNAIRFQEIMAEAYTLGGASASEQHQSMYQMIQALGAGILAGDELRSVREGAPLAYKEIEKFAQGIYNTEESLKELASQGKITSDIVVAAIMGAGDKIDERFAKTEITFAQAWDMTKNTAIKAFEPVMQKLANLLSDKRVQSAIDGLGKAFLVIADIIAWVFTKIGAFFKWCADNWDWLKYIVIGVLGAIVAKIVWATTVAIAKAIVRIGWWLVENAVMLGIYATIALLVAGIVWLANTTCTGCEFMFYALLMVAGAILLIGIITGNMALIVIAIIVALAALFLNFAEQICYWTAWLAGWIVNILSFLWNIIVSLVQLVVGIVVWALATIYNLFVALVNACLEAVWAFIDPFLGIIEFILNACNGGFNSFGGAVANLIGQIIGWFLSLGKVVTTIIDAIFGTNWTAGLNSLKDSVTAWGKNDQAITISREAPALKRLDATDAFSESAAFVGKLHTGYVDPNSWADSAGEWGAGITEKAGKIGSSIKDKISGFDLSTMLQVGKSYDAAEQVANTAGNLGDAGTLGDYGSLPTGSNVGDTYKGKTPAELLAGIGDDTDKLVKLSEEDLEYLRKIAEMEWKKEYTTVNIKTDLTNNNTVNSEFDLRSLAIALRDTIEEEMYAVADGVYS